MRRLILAVVLAACAVVPARADDRVLTAALLRYLPDPVTITERDRLDFVNTDPASLTDGHDVTHNAPAAQRLFFSETILVGGRTRVTGVELLEPGTYPFVCTRHATMRGTLVVTPDQYGST